MGFAVGKVIGQDEVSGELESVAVAVDRRREGAGRALCEAVIAWCRGQRASKVQLEVRSANAGAIRLYEKLGFVRIAIRKGYYREPADDANLMKLELPA